MPAYLFGETLEVTDPAKLAEYGKAAGATVKSHGGKVLFAGPGNPLEGDWQPGRVIIIEFESAEKLKAWYDSAEYQKVLPLRLGASRGNVVVFGD